MTCSEVLFITSLAQGCNKFFLITCWWDVYIIVKHDTCWWDVHIIVKHDTCWWDVHIIVNHDTVPRQYCYWGFQLNAHSLSLINDDLFIIYLKFKLFIEGKKR